MPTHQPISEAVTPLARGVYRAPFTRGGCPVFFAVRAGGELAGEVVADGIRVTESEAREFMVDLLALCDAPTLTLISDAPSDLPLLSDVPVAEIPARLLRRPLRLRL